MQRLIRSLCLLALGLGCAPLRPAGTGEPDAGGSSSVGQDAGDADPCDADQATSTRCAAQCAAEDESCSASDCCDGLECLALNGGPRVCHARCEAASDCGSGCCVGLRDSDHKLCGAQEICFPNGCAAQAAACSADAPCCAGLTCVSGAEPESRNGCRQRCRQHDDCESGCCVPFAGGDGEGFCDAALYCTCIEPGDPCADTGRDCCEGSRCARFEDRPFRCVQTCTSDEDCGGNCCASIGDGARVCAPFAC